MLAILVALTLWVLAARGTPWHVYLSVWVSWGMALALVALVPIDLHIVYLKRCIDHYGKNVQAQVKNICITVRTRTHVHAVRTHADTITFPQLSALRKSRRQCSVFSRCGSAFNILTNMHKPTSTQQSLSNRPMHYSPLSHKIARARVLFHTHLTRPIIRTHTHTHLQIQTVHM